MENRNFRQYSIGPCMMVVDIYKILVVTVLCIGQSASNPFYSQHASNTQTEHELKERLLSYYDPANAFYQFPPLGHESYGMMATSAENNPDRQRCNAPPSNSYGNTCPGYFVNNTNSNRIPSVIAEWRCSCQRCRMPRNSVLYFVRNRYSCKPIYQLYQTLHSSDGSSPNAEWNMRFEPIAVGCKCEEYRLVTSLIF